MRYPHRWAVLLAMVALTARPAIEAPAQGLKLSVLFGTPKTRETTDTPGDNAFSAILQPSEEATTLLGRANEGLQREDWKLVIDSLQRIIELPGEHVLARDERVYESARRQAHRRIAKLPPAGLEAYRLVYDGEASALLERAIESHDVSLVQTIVERFLLTRTGDDAAVTLADWLIDEGRFAEAAALLQRVQSVYPDSDLPGWVLPSRLAICAAGMGQRQRARQWLDLTVATRPAATEPGDLVSTAASAERIERVREFIARASPAAGAQPAGRWPLTGEEVRGWPMAMGTPRRDGQMPAVEPTFIDHPPWNVPLPVTDPKPGLGVIEQYARERELTPAREMVTDGRRLIFKTDRRLLALDLDSFTAVWQTEPQEWVAETATQGVGQVIAPQVWQQGGDAHPLDREPMMWRLLYDTVGSGLTIVGDKVLTVEWQGEPPMPMGLILGGGRRSRVMMGGVWPGRDGSSGAGNRVLAYAIEDGSLRWASDTTALASSADSSSAAAALPLRRVEAAAKAGAGGPAEEGQPSHVQFLSAPVPVGQYLLAPCRVNADLYAVVLDAATGVMVRRVYLCGTGGGPFDVLSGLEPAVADGVVFIPTGRGMLLAIETDTWSIRWAVRYEQTTAISWAPAWDPTPVIAVADVVLLAPTDADYLYCVDQATGEVRWKAPRGGSRYVLGATDQRVWTAGQQVQMLEVETGRSVWQVRVPKPTGRGVMTGAQICLPTVEGITALDATTGEQAAVSVPATLEPLGNLLAWDGSLYSAGISRIRKFPDLKEGYAEAVRRHEANPADVSAAMRLASLELLKHRPAEALAAMAKLPEGLQRDDPSRHEHAAHLGVLSMLELAGSGEVLPARSLELLREAKKIARRPADAIDVTLALADHYQRENQPLEACLEHLSVILSKAGDELILTEPGFQERARSRSGRRIAEAIKGCNAEQLVVFQGRVRDWLAGVASKHEWDSLMWLAESPGLGDLACQARLLLGTWAEQDLRFEQAECLFADVLRQAQSPELLAEAAARLAAIHLAPAELHLPVSASALLDRLSKEFAAVKLPADVLRPAGELAEKRQRDGATEKQRDKPPEGVPPSLGLAVFPSPPSGAQAAEVLRQRLDGAVLTQHRSAMTAVSLGRPEQPTASNQPGARPLSVRGPRLEPLADVTLAMTEGRRVEARSVADGRRLWPAELRLLGQPVLDAQPPEIVVLQQERGISPPASESVARGVCDGQTLILNSAYGLHALGLLTGRRLWARPFDPPSGSQSEPSGSDAWLWTHEGYVVTVNAKRELEAASTVDGERVLWRRSLAQRPWYAVRARGPYVVVVDRPLEQVAVFRLDDGRYLGECRFAQDASSGPKVNIALFDDVICGPVSGREVAALELATPGAERWRMSMPDALSQVFKPTPELVAVADRSGRVELIDPASGKRQLAATAYQCEAGVVDGVGVGDVLYVYGYQRRPAPGSSQGEQRWTVAAIGMSDGHVRWQRSDIGAGAFLTGDLLRVSSDAIPLAVFKPAVERRADVQVVQVGAEGPQTLDAVELAILDKATGQIVGETISAPVPQSAGGRRILDVQVWPGKVMVSVGSMTLRFAVPPRDGPAAGAPAAAVQSVGGPK